MYDSELAIVDVETTGLSAQFNRVIEIAVVRVRGNEVVETYSSLVDPGVTIPPYVEGLTGITNGDLKGAPDFSAIRNDVMRVLEGAVFVAHNARFDYDFIKEEFRRARMMFSAKCLCTMRLSRRLFPEQRKHGLDSIMGRFGLQCSSRHRALGDAMLLWDFIKAIKGRFEESTLKQAFAKVLKTPVFPPLVDESAVKNLPESTGVYIFRNQDGGPLYVGKSTNIRGRVLSHFSDGSASAREDHFSRQTTDIKAIETAGEFGALILETRLIKELQPLYNRRSRAAKRLVVAKKAGNESGYITVRLEQTDFIDPGDLENIVGIFKSTKQAKEFFREAASQQRLCPRMLGLEKGGEECTSRESGKCEGACTGAEPPSQYNLRFAMATTGRSVRAWPFSGPVLIEEKAGNGTAGDAFLMDKWCLLASFEFDEHGPREKFSGDYIFDYEIYRILLHYLMRPGNKPRLREITREEMEALRSRT